MTVNDLITKEARRHDEVEDEKKKSHKLRNTLLGITGLAGAGYLGHKYGGNIWNKLKSNFQPPVNKIDPGFLIPTPEPSEGFGVIKIPKGLSVERQDPGPSNIVNQLKAAIGNIGLDQPKTQKVTGFKNPDIQRAIAGRKFLAAKKPALSLTDRLGLEQAIQKLQKAPEAPNPFDPTGTRGLMQQSPEEVMAAVRDILSQPDIRQAPSTLQKILDIGPRSQEKAKDITRTGYNNLSKAIERLGDTITKPVIAGIETMNEGIGKGIASISAAYGAARTAMVDQAEMAANAMAKQVAAGEMTIAKNREALQALYQQIAKDSKQAANIFYERHLKLR